MAVFIISNNCFFQHGIICAGKDKGLEIVCCQFGDALLDKLSYNDIVILHLNLENKYHARKISSLNQQCKVLLVVGSTQGVLICDADMVMNDKVSPDSIMQALLRLSNQIKFKPTKNRPLNRIERIIINKSLEGKNAHVIAHALSMSSKLVCNYRHKACRKIGARRLTDLLIIKEHLIDDCVL